MPITWEFKTIEIEKVTKGDFLRKVGKKRVFQAKGYCRFNKKYEAEANDDISYSAYFKKGTMVEIGFDF